MSASSLYKPARRLMAAFAAATMLAVVSVAADEQNALLALSIDIVQNRIADIEANTQLDEGLRTAITDLHRRTVASLESAASFTEAAREYQQTLETAPADTERLQRQLAAEVVAENTVDGLTGLSTAELETRVLKGKAELTVLEAQVNELRANEQKVEDRPTRIRELVAQLNEELAATAVVVDEGAGDPPELRQAKEWWRLARERELRARIAMLRDELASQPVRLTRLRVERQLAQARTERARVRLTALENSANASRLADVAETREQAAADERLAADKPPALQALAQRNVELSEKLSRLAKRIERLRGRERALTERAGNIEDALTATREKIEVAGVSQILGQILQEQRRNLPDAKAMQRETRAREEEIAETTLAQILLEEERELLSDEATFVSGLIAQLDEPEQTRVRGEAVQIARSRLDLVGKALDIQGDYLRVVAELDFAQRRLIRAVEQTDDFLDERLLWVRSTQPVGLETLALIPVQAGRLFHPDHADEMIEAAIDGLTTSLWPSVSLLLVLGLVLQTRRLQAYIRSSGRYVGSLTNDHLGYTLQALGALVLVVLPAPLLMFLVGGLLSGSLQAGEFSKQVGEALQGVAILLAELLLLARFVEPNGIARVHLGWRDRGLNRLGTELTWFTPTLVLTSVFTWVAMASAAQLWGGGLGRAAFIIVMAVMAVFFYRVSHPSRGIIADLFEDHPDGALFRLRYLWFVLLTGAPLVAIVESLAGYMYTAAMFVSHLVQSTWLVLLVAVLYQLAVRWLVLNKRKLRWQEIQARREALREAREQQAEGDADDASDSTWREVEEPKVDIKALDLVSRKLTKNTFLLIGLVGLAWIWRDLLPALSVLDDFVLWRYTIPGDSEALPFTLSSLGLVVLIFIVMILTTRQFPAFLEIVLLQRMQMSPGSRYTVVTLIKYTVVAIGVAWIFSTLGGSWSEIQWIFAALGVGIGFGLQEIVANFISGLIILFERPIRVGDVVTVGNTDGVVTRIRIRATTIRNWDRKELLVPNKNFITQELLNWSLSDRTTRIMINVGVAYGSAVEEALAIMKQVALDNTRVLSDPAPFVVFDTFGDNALNLSLRCYIDDIDSRLTTITELNLEINRRLEEAGIVIAFPQRDIHLDTTRPLEVHLSRKGAESDDSV